MRPKTEILILLLSIFSLIGISCIGAGDGNPYSPGTNGSDGALPPRTDPREARKPAALNESSIGLRTVSNYELQKSAPVYLRKDHAALRVGPDAYIVRSYRTQSVPYLIIPVENVSSDSVTGFTKLVGVSVIADGYPAQTYKSIFVHGKVGVSVATGVYTRSCLWPRMTGYFLEVVERADFADNFQIEIDSVVSNAAEFRDPYEQVYAYNYNVFNDTLEVWAENYGSYSADVDNSWLYVLLDYRSEPVIWGFTEAWNSGILNPGSITRRIKPIRYEGDANRILVLVDYEPVYSGLSRKKELPGDSERHWLDVLPENPDGVRLHRLQAREARRETLHRGYLPQSEE